MTTVFQQKKAYRDLNIFDIFNLTDDEVREIFKSIRWGDGDEVTCPYCQKKDKHYFISTREQWSCRNCNHRFGVMSSTPFSNHKLPLRKILVLIYIFISSPQGQSANSLHAQFGATIKTIFHNMSKIREVLFETMDFTPMNGLVHIDCAHFCGKPRRSNKRQKTDSFVINNKLRNRKDAIVPDKSTHPEPQNIKKLEKRRIILAISQVGLSIPSAPSSPPILGSNRTIAIILKAEKAATILPIIKKYVSKDAYIMTDSGSAFQPLFRELGISHSMVNHSKEYMTADGTNNNMAEAFFSRVRRAEFGTYNGMRPQYFAFYAAEFTWRNDTRHMTLREKFEDVLKRIFTRETSKAFCNYNHGHRLGFEYVTN
jgi:transposase-like protein